MKIYENLNENLFSFPKFETFVKEIVQVIFSSYLEIIFDLFVELAVNTKMFQSSTLVQIFSINS